MFDGARSFACPSASMAGGSAPYSGKTAAAAGDAQSGVQHPISSWSAAVPVSAPDMEHASEGAALAAPGVSANDSAMRRERKNLMSLKDAFG